MISKLCGKISASHNDHFFLEKITYLKLIFVNMERHLLFLVLFIIRSIYFIASSEINIYPK